MKWVGRSPVGAFCFLGPSAPSIGCVCKLLSVFVCLSCLLHLTASTKPRGFNCWATFAKQSSLALHRPPPLVLRIRHRRDTAAGWPSQTRCRCVRTQLRTPSRHLPTSSGPQAMRWPRIPRSQLPGNIPGPAYGSMERPLTRFFPVAPVAPAVQLCWQQGRPEQGRKQGSTRQGR